MLAKRITQRAVNRMPKDLLEAPDGTAETRAAGSGGLNPLFFSGPQDFQSLFMMLFLVCFCCS